jgi:hypothetical protein
MVKDFSSFFQNYREELNKLKLAPAEQEFANTLDYIAEKYGKLSDNDNNGIWVGYVPPEKNDNLKIGVVCGNCYFYEGENVCRIIQNQVNVNGYCRLAAIYPGLVSKS